MSPLDILKFTRAKPFKPFRLLVTDDTTYDIPHPEFCMVLPAAVVVGVEENEATGGPGGAVWIDANHIHKLIPLDRPAPAGSAQSNGPPG